MSIELSHTDRAALQNKLTVEVFELKRSMEKLRKKIDRNSHRTLLWDAAHAALHELLQTAEATLTHLQQTQATAPLIEAQLALKEKYERALARLPKHSRRILTRAEIHLMEMKYAEMQARYERLTEAMQP
ncbi:MAG: hypothetical protein WEC59_05560 [Salibacteraceae bacterium]